MSLKTAGIYSTISPTFSGAMEGSSRDICKCSIAEDAVMSALQCSAYDTIR